MWLQDDYVKFIRLSQWLLDGTGVGVHGYISNHGYLNNPTFRGMRWSLMQSFQRIRVIDLHGNLKKKEVPPGGGRDVNVFDIQQGVAIGLFAKTHRGATHVRFADLWGEREHKYSWLLDDGADDTDWTELVPALPFCLFEPLDESATGSYYDWPPINEIMPVNSVGIVTARDHLTIHFDPEATWKTVSDFSRIGEEAARAKYRLRRDAQSWKVRWAQDDVRASGPSRFHLAPIMYRPFDRRWTYYTGKSGGFICRPLGDLMPHMLAGENCAIITARSNKSPQPNHFFCSRTIVETKCGEASTQSATFPLYLYPGVGKANGSLFNRLPKGEGGRTPNLDSGFVEQITAATKLRFISDGGGNLRKTLGPEDVLAYIYAVFHSPGYRDRYEAQFKLDFPRVPLPGSVQLFRRLAEAGHELLVLHVLESLKLNQFLTTYTGPRTPEVGRVGWSDGTVWLDAGKTNAREGHRATKPGTIGFQDVPEEVWDFQIGGYQVCHKWLKDRKGRTLSDEDVAHYQKIVVALNETIRIMAEIDEVINHHGGWPDAFQAG